MRETGIAVFIDASKAKVGAAQFKGAIEGIKNSAKGAVSSIKTGFSGLKSTFGGLRGSIAAVGAALFFRQLVQVNTQFERMRGSLTTITGSAGLANKEFAALQEFAKSTPFTLDQSVNAFIKLQNLGIRPSEALLKSFGNTSAAMGKELNQFIEAVADASTFEFERLKEFGIKSRQQGDQVSFTFQNVTTTVKKNSEDVVKYLQNIGDVNFAGAMDDQMKRLPGILSNLEDSFSQLAGAIGEGGFTQAVGELATTISNMITDLIDSGRAAQFGRILGEAFKFIGNVAASVSNVLINFFTGIDEAFAQISNRIAAFMQGVDFQDVNKLFEDERTAAEIARLSAMQPGTFKIGDSLPSTASSRDNAATAAAAESAKKAAESIQDYIKETRNSTQEIERQIRFIEDQGAAFDEQSASYRRLQAEISAEQQLREAGIPIFEKNGDTLAKLTEIILENSNAEEKLGASLEKVQKIRENREAVNQTLSDLAQERDDLVKLNAARAKGIKAYQDAETAIQANTQARQLGISLYSIEGDNIRGLIEEIKELQTELQKPIYRTWTEGAIDALHAYGEKARDVGTGIADAMTNALGNMEDAFTDFFTKGKMDFQSFADSLVADINRVLVRQLIMAPITGAIQNGLSTGGLFGGLFGGGSSASTIPVNRPDIQSVPIKMAKGGIVTKPTIALIGESGPEEVRPLNKANAGSTNYVFNITTPDADSFRQSQTQLMEKAYSSSVQNQRRNGGF
jgi:lambda family phage tail tape measure protein